MNQPSVDLTGVKIEDLPTVQKLLDNLSSHQKYNTNLRIALDRAYDWQKKAVAFTKKHRVVGITCGNQMGKSEITSAMLACHLTGVYPDWWEGKKYDRPVKVMAAGVDSNHNKNVIQERLFGTNNWRMKDAIGSGMIPKNTIVEGSGVTVRGDDLTSIKIYHASKKGYSELIFRAYSQGREAAQGFQADIIMIDEQPSDDFWREALTRTRATRGHVICSFTPLLGKTGLVQQLLDLPGIKNSPEDMFGPKYKSDGKWACIRASWFDAPHIPKEDIEDAKRDYIHDYDARVYGMPMAGYGAIFPHLEGDMIYDPREKHINETWPHLIGLDIGSKQDDRDTNRDPSAIVFAAWDEDEDIIYVTDAWEGPTPTVKELTRAICSLDHRAVIAWPNDANKTSINSDSTIAEQLRERDLNLLAHPFRNPKGADGKNNNFKMPGIDEINSRFREGRLLISKDLTLLLEEVTGYAFDKNGKIQDGGDDLVDALRYTVMSMIQGYGEPLAEYHVPYNEVYEDFTFNSY